MGRKFATRISLMLIAVFAAGTNLVTAQQPTPSGVAFIDRQIEEVRWEKEWCQRQLGYLREGVGGTGLLIVGRNQNGEMVPELLSGKYEAVAEKIVLPMSPDKLAETVVLRMMAGEITRDQAKSLILNIRDGARAKQSREVLEAIERAGRDFAIRLALVNAEITALQAARERLLAGGNNPPAQNTGVRVGSGVLRDAQGNRPIGHFEIKMDGRRTQLTLTYGPTNKLIGTEESFDSVNQTAIYKFEYKLPDDFLGVKARGHAKVNLRTNIVTDSIEEAFDSQTNTWNAIPKPNWIISNHTLVWGAKLEDRRILSERAKLEAAPGKNNAEVTFMIQLQAGTQYTFELKAPATRLYLKGEKVGGNTRFGRTMPERGKPARTTANGPNQGLETWRISIIGSGPNLPANFELEVWERWLVNGNIPPLSWDSEYVAP